MPTMTLPAHVSQYGNLHRIVVVFVVRGELVMPFEFACIGVEGDYRSRVEIVARPLSSVIVGAGVAHTPIVQVEFRVE